MCTIVYTYFYYNTSYRRFRSGGHCQRTRGKGKRMMAAALMCTHTHTHAHSDENNGKNNNYMILLPCTRDGPPCTRRVFTHLCPYALSLSIPIYLYVRLHTEATSVYSCVYRVPMYPCTGVKRGRRRTVKIRTEPVRSYTAGTSAHALARCAPDRP